MSEKLRFAEAVCAGHPDRLADTIAERIVALAVARDPEALVGVEVALHRNVVFVDGRVAAGRETAAVAEGEIVAIARQAFADAGYGTTPSGVFRPDPGDLEVRTDLCLGPLPEDERAIRDVSDDQSICVGHAVWGPRAGHRPLEQALASDFAAALERLRVERPDLGLGPDGKTLVAVSGRALVGVSLSVHHAPGIDWVALTREARRRARRWPADTAGGSSSPRAGSGLARQRGGRVRGRRPPGRQRPLGQEARRPGLWVRGADRRGSDPRQGPAQGRPAGPGARPASRSRRRHHGLGTGGDGLAGLPPGRLTPRWVEVATLPDDEHTEEAKVDYWQSASDAYRENLKRASKRRN